MHIEIIKLENKSFVVFFELNLGKGSKKNMENSILGGRGGSVRIIFHIQFFFIIFAPNGLKIVFRH